MKFRPLLRATVVAGALAVSGLGASMAPAGAAPLPAASAACAASAHPLSRPLDHPSVSPALARSIQANVARRAKMSLAGPVVINVRAHVLKSTNAARPWATDSMIATQIAEMNDAYAGGQLPGTASDTGFQFRLYDTSTTTNTDWYWSEPGSRAEWDMKRALHRGHPYALNLYFKGYTEASQLLGYSTFPWDQASYPRQDGVEINVRTMPGGDLDPYSLGDTAVHEAGHWLGLYHTFEFGCQPGDYVADTVRERTPTEGCPEGKDTCPAGTTDPIHNFMDYSYDACMNQFTPGQTERMQQAWAEFRAP